MKRIGIREARKVALEMAAAMVRDADFGSLFGDELVDRSYDQEDGDEILSRAQHEIASRIERMGKP